MCGHLFLAYATKKTKGKIGCVLFLPRLTIIAGNRSDLFFLLISYYLYRLLMSVPFPVSPIKCLLILISGGCLITLCAIQIISLHAAFLARPWDLVSLSAF